MEMPRPGDAHKKLAALVGDWTGDETLHPSPWDPAGGAAQAQVTNRWVADGFAVVQEYEQRRNGKVTFRGHGVFWFDPDARRVRHALVGLRSAARQGNFAGGSMATCWRCAARCRRVATRARPGLISGDDCAHLPDGSLAGWGVVAARDGGPLPKGRRAARGEEDGEEDEARRRRPAAQEEIGPEGQCDAKVTDRPARGRPTEPERRPEGHAEAMTGIRSLWSSVPSCRESLRTLAGRARRMISTRSARSWNSRPSRSMTTAVGRSTARRRNSASMALKRRTM